MLFFFDDTLAVREMLLGQIAYPSETAAAKHISSLLFGKELLTRIIICYFADGSDMFVHLSL